jgi:hypothetical protein
LSNISQSYAGLPDTGAVYVNLKYADVNFKYWHSVPAENEFTSDRVESRKWKNTALGDMNEAFSDHEDSSANKYVRGKQVERGKIKI